MLSDEEKAYARRMFAFAMTSLFIESDLQDLNEMSIDMTNHPDYFEPTHWYQKWGLGAKTTGFTLEEKVYLALLPNMPAYWEAYNRTDLESVSQDDADWLARLHEEYGEGPIHCSALREEWGDSKPNITLLAIAEALSGSEYLNDRSLLVIHGIARAMVLFLMS